MRIALGIEYDGSKYSGWQRQQNVIAVQQRLEEAVASVANHSVDIICAGRTDAGVHATGQVIHFDTDSVRDTKAWTLGVNTNLPYDIAVRWAQEVAPDFDARFTAYARRYRYIIYNHRLRPAINQVGITHLYGDIDEKRMHEAAQALLGEQDFTAFRASFCQSHTPFRKISHCNVTRFGNYIMVDIQANAFLHHMVRNIVGSLVEIGRGNEKIEWIAELLASKDRTLAAATAPANGLYLVRVFYPEAHPIPRTPMGPLFLPDENWL